MLLLLKEVVKTKSNTNNITGDLKPTNHLNKIYIIMRRIVIPI